MIQAPLSAPKAISHAGSSDWKNSSGWKKVLTLRALSIRNATRKSRTSWETVGYRTSLKACLGRFLSDLKESNDTSLDDIAS